jgi:hypothetical protein
MRSPEKRSASGQIDTRRLGLKKSASHVLCVNRMRASGLHPNDFDFCAELVGNKLRKLYNFIFCFVFVR